MQPSTGPEMELLKGTCHSISPHFYGLAPNISDSAFVKKYFCDLQSQATIYHGPPGF